MQAPQTRPSLTDLHGVSIPEPVSFVPTTTAWYILGAAVAAALLAACFLFWRRWEANRYRRVALARMVAIADALAEPSSRDAALNELPELTKQVALACNPRRDVAGLSGEAWLEFLDASFTGHRFTRGPGRLLPAIAYGPAAVRATITDADIDELTALLRDWIRGHHARV